VVWNGVILDATRIKQAELDLRRAKESAEESSRLQAELLDKLQSADERLSSLAATIPGVVYQRLVTPDGDIRYTYISEGTRDLFGVEPEDILNDPQALFGRHGPEYRKTFRDRLLAASKSLTLWDVEAQIVTADGQEKWTHAIARPNRLEDGSVLWNGVILDSTRIKEAEFAAAAAEERTRAAIVESISQGIAIFDPDDRLMTWNSKLEDLFPGLGGAIEVGADYRTILRAEADGCVEPDGSAPGEQMLRDRIKSHDHQESSVERRLADGRWILINERRSDAGTIVLYTDVTDLKRREEQLHLAKNRSERANAEMEKTVRRLDIALGNMTQGLCLFDSQLRSILCNRRYAKIFRLPPELTGPGIALHDQISHVAGSGKASEADAMALVDDRLSFAANRARCTYRLTLPDRRVIEVIHQPLPDGGAVETFTEVDAHSPQALMFGAESARGDGDGDVGEAALPTAGHAESAAAIARARDEARSAERGKAEFLRAFGQALKASLETIVDTSEAMTGAVYGPLGDQRYQQFAKSIRDSGTALMSMIDDIEEISTLSAGDIELSEQPLDLGALLARCIRVARYSTEGKAPTISIATPSDGYEVNADETKLRQAFLNLLTNAVRFTPASGRVEVTIGGAEDGGVDVAIADTGSGMAPKILSALMGRPASGNGAGSRAVDGGHLGLPVVRSLIERHGGSLVLASGKGRGTTAVVHLPDSRVLARPRAGNT
jgi:signal transduction histidine kinase